MGNPARPAGLGWPWAGLASPWALGALEAPEMTDFRQQYLRTNFCQA